MPAEQSHPQSAQKLTCLCSPTTHAGSFRCRFHRASDNNWLVSHGSPHPKPISLSPKLSVKPFSEYHGSEKPSKDLPKSSIIPKLPLICKPVSAGIPRPSRLSNEVSSIGATEKPSGKAATSTSGAKIEAVNNQARHTKPTQPAIRSHEAGIFAVGKCQSPMSSMQSEAPRPIFSS